MECSTKYFMGIGMIHQCISWGTKMICIDVPFSLVIFLHPCIFWGHTIFFVGETFRSCRYIHILHMLACMEIPRVASHPAGYTGYTGPGIEAKAASA